VVLVSSPYVVLRSAKERTSSRGTRRNATSRSLASFTAGTAFHVKRCRPLPTALCRLLESLGMKPNPPRLDSCQSREILVVVALTLIGALLRLWSLGRLGLVHFDEGIYAAAGLWVFSRNGFLDLGPSLIAYAPPGFPFLVGVAYYVLGASDLPAILVSIVSGTLTIPAVAWLARRTFGIGAAGAAAAFAAISGTHVAYSRMALTDASFLLFWVLALVAGQRFLERPSASRAFILGLAVGVAQLFKYNGWLAGGIVVLTAILWLARNPRELRSRRAVATWGWGLVAALVATAVYWPWFAFVESHGGYGALLAHQRSYLGGLKTWPGHLMAQLAQSRALSGGPVWPISSALAAAIAMTAIRQGPAGEWRSLARILLPMLSLAACFLLPNLAWWVPLAWLPGFAPRNRTVDLGPVIFLYAGWVALFLLTPFYHPYARLWLPVEAFGWLFIGGMFADVGSRVNTAVRVPAGKSALRLVPTLWVILVAASALNFEAAVFGFTRASRLPGLLAPSDALRSACASIARDLPKDVKFLRVFARPPVTFYLGQFATVSLDRQPSLSRLFEQSDAATWALLDMAIVRQDQSLGAELKRSSSAWVLVRAIPSNLSLPVLLDIDPSAATSANVDAEVELRLFRPKRAGDLQ
jgi:dolichyl-phosphate-mannose-protein mannosyltransferase